jgi:hypothetical protein
MRERFWTACREANVTLDLSLYPAMQGARHQLEQLCTDHGAALNVVVRNTFLAGLNARGDSDPVQTMKYCRSQCCCPYLSDSRLYVYALPATAKYSIDGSIRAIPDDPGIDIFDPTLNGNDFAVVSLDAVHTGAHE